MFTKYDGKFRDSIDSGIVENLRNEKNVGISETGTRGGGDDVTRALADRCVNRDIFPESDKKSAVSKIKKLTKSEAEVVELLMKGYSQTKIGQLLSVKAGTVHMRVYRLMRKMGAGTVVHLIAKLLKQS